MHPMYIRYVAATYRLRKAERWEEAHRIRRQMQQLPSLDPTDPDYRRIRYLRYADDGSSDWMDHEKKLRKSSNGLGYSCATRSN